MEQKRQSHRLQGFDYTSSGAYFVTICSYRRNLLFENAEVGKVLEVLWREIPEHFTAETDLFVVMPNHVHGIVWIGKADQPVGVQHAGPLQAQGRFVTPGSLGAIVRSFKSAATREFTFAALSKVPSGSATTGTASSATKTN